MAADPKSTKAVVKKWRVIKLGALVGHVFAATRETATVVAQAQYGAAVSVSEASDIKSALNSDLFGSIFRGF